MQAAKLDKASFLAELRGIGQSKGTAKGTGPALPAGTGLATAALPAPPQAQGAPGWGVLSESFGLQGVVMCLPIILSLSYKYEPCLNIVYTESPVLSCLTRCENWGTEAVSFI